MSEQAATPGSLEELMALARERQFEALEAAWMRRLEQGPRDLAELFSVAEYMVRKKHEEKAALLLWSLVASVTEKESPRQALEAAVRAAMIAPAAKALREEVATLYRKTAPDVPELGRILDASGLLKGVDVKVAVRTIEQCLRLRPGSFVTHARSRRMGRVVGFAEDGFTIESDRQAQKLPPSEAIAQWEAVPPDDFRALAAFEPDRLRRLAAEDPVHLLQLLLRAVNGRAEFKQVKFMLIPVVIPADGWSAWWNKVKVVLRRSPTLEISEGTQPTFTLRAGETDYAGKFRASFADLADPFEKVKRVLAYVDEVDAGHAGDPALAAHLGEELLKVERAATEPAVALTVLATVAALRKRFDSVPDPREELTRKAAELTNAEALITQIPLEEVARMVLNCLKEVLPDRWPELYAYAFPAASLRLCDFIARELTRAGRDDLLQAAAERVVAAPEQYGEAFGWTWRWLLADNDIHSNRLDRISVTISLLDLMNRLSRVPKHLEAEKRAELRQLLGRLRNLVMAGEMKLMRALVASTSAEDARRLHTAIIRNEGLADARGDLLTALREHHPEQFDEKKPLWEDGRIYTTAEGLRRRQDEFHKLTTEDMPRNAEAIGKAASLGDLRENWEYKSALEERDRLVERATRAKAELDRAHVIPAAALTGEEVNIGTTVRLRDTRSGQERRVTFLGPWDSNIPQGIYSYLAPLSLKFMGKRLGDRLQATFDDIDSEYEILGIEKAV